MENYFQQQLDVSAECMELECVARRVNIRRPGQQATNKLSANLLGLCGDKLALARHGQTHHL